MRRRGFSLVELVIALAIMGTMVLLVRPRYMSSVARYRVDAASRRVVADVEMAQTAAGSRGTPQLIRFDMTRSRYEIPTLEHLDRPSLEMYDVDLRRAPYKSELVGASFNGLRELEFDGFGLPRSGGAIVVEAGRERRVIIVEADGEVRIE